MTEQKRIQTRAQYAQMLDRNHGYMPFRKDMIINGCCSFIEIPDEIIEDPELMAQYIIEDAKDKLRETGLGGQK